MSELLETLPEAIAHWRTTDPVLADLAESTPLERRLEDEPDPFHALVRAIVHQQVSLAAGRTIYARVADATGPTPAGILAAGEVRLRELGLSRAKATYCLDLAGRVADGWDLAALDALPDDEVVRELTAVKGIGVWSAKMHLLFHMQRPDVLPWEDLGVRLAVDRFYGVPEPLAAKWLQQEANARWSPHCSLATRVLWAARRASEERG